LAQKISCKISLIVWFQGFSQVLARLHCWVFCCKELQSLTRTREEILETEGVAWDAAPFRYINTSALIRRNKVTLGVFCLGSIPRSSGRWHYWCQDLLSSVVSPHPFWYNGPRTTFSATSKSVISSPVFRYNGNKNHLTFVKSGSWHGHYFIYNPKSCCVAVIASKCAVKWEIWN